MIIYVPGGELTTPEAVLQQELNQMRFNHPHLTVRTDQDGSQTQQVVENWARIRGMTVQHHGRPDAIIVQGLPRSLTDQPEGIKNEARTLWKDQRETTWTGIQEWLKDLFYGRQQETVWLAQEDRNSRDHQDEIATEAPAETH